MRSYKTAFPPAFLTAYQAGVMQHSYRGVRCLKSPIDMAIYGRAIWDLGPGTVIEIGSHSGGSALWLADTLRSYGLDAHVYSIDLQCPVGVADPRISFLQGDVLDLEAAFSGHRLTEMPHPWFVTEDSAHTFQGCISALAFLAQHMISGDLLVMEDGVLDELGLFAGYDGGPNRALAVFMADNPGVFEVETGLCDMFGVNATYAPNGYLRKA